MADDSLVSGFESAHVVEDESFAPEALVSAADLVDVLVVDFFAVGVLLAGFVRAGFTSASASAFVFRLLLRVAQG